VDSRSSAPAARTLGTPASRCLVTGASSGIGEAFARALAARGDRLILVARRADRLAALAGQLGGDEAAAVIPADLSRAGAVDALEAAVRSRGFEVDVLVNNAGFGSTGPFVGQDRERLGAMVSLNVGAVVGLTRAFLPDMLARGRGTVVNVVSLSAFQPVPFLAVYAATKAFVLSFTEAVRHEVRGSGVEIQALCPGNVPTGFQVVAGTDRVRFDRTAATAAADVVEASLAALGKRRSRVIPGWRNRVGVALQGFVPRGLVLRAAAELFRPRPGPDGG
jgi:uncharacterized protein